MTRVAKELGMTPTQIWGKMIAVNMLLFEQRDLLEKLVKLKTENEVVSMRLSKLPNKFESIQMETVTKKHMTEFPKDPSTLKLSSLSLNKNVIIWRKKNLISKFIFNPEFDGLFSLFIDRTESRNPLETSKHPNANRQDIVTAARTIFALALANGMVNALDIDGMIKQVTTFSTKLENAEDYEIANTIHGSFKNMRGTLIKEYIGYKATGKNPIEALHLALENNYIVTEWLDDSFKLERAATPESESEQEPDPDIEERRRFRREYSFEYLEDYEQKNPNFGCKFDNDEYLYQGKNRQAKDPLPALWFSSYGAFRRFRYLVKKTCIHVMERTTYDDVHQLLRYSVLF